MRGAKALYLDGVRIEVTQALVADILYAVNSGRNTVVVRDADFHADREVYTFRVDPAPPDGLAADPE